MPRRRKRKRGATPEVVSEPVTAAEPDVQDDNDAVGGDAPERSTSAVTTTSGALGLEQSFLDALDDLEQEEERLKKRPKAHDAKQRRKRKKKKKKRREGNKTGSVHISGGFMAVTLHGNPREQRQSATDFLRKQFHGVQRGQ